MWAIQPFRYPFHAWHVLGNSARHLPISSNAQIGQPIAYSLVSTTHAVKTMHIPSPFHALPKSGHWGQTKNTGLLFSFRLPFFP